MYNYVRDSAVAMGNSGDARYLPHLRDEFANPDPTVRSHAEWTIGKLDVLYFPGSAGWLAECGRCGQPADRL